MVVERYPLVRRTQRRTQELFLRGTRYRILIAHEVFRQRTDLQWAPRPLSARRPLHPTCGVPSPANHRYGVGRRRAHTCAGNVSARGTPAAAVTTSSRFGV